METYHQRNKEKIKAYIKKWQAEHPEKIKIYRLNYAEKQKEYYRKWYKENGRNRADNYVEKILEWQQEHPDRRKIQRQLQFAVKSGKIKRPEICPKCQREAQIQAHHFNYKHFMNFVWLCASCHKKEHLNNNH